MFVVLLNKGRYVPLQSVQVNCDTLSRNKNILTIAGSIKGRYWILRSAGVLPKIANRAKFWPFKEVQRCAGEFGARLPFRKIEWIADEELAKMRPLRKGEKL
jgi:hypothetical protein